MNRFCVERMYNTNADVYLDYPFLRSRKSYEVHLWVY